MKQFKIHSKSNGKLYIKPSEIFNNDDGKAMVKRLRNSSIYKSIKKLKGGSAAAQCMPFNLLIFPLIGGAIVF
ncbi:hypothetical protein C900_00797 [Fulvivirga imtechensis AK7]|uniref:Uncharacterized protein n=1 Tax=Fulvivirga imtechensis AK7 TaxID=1237149 RepID=L8JV09_9BACT|nr:hypothetical protein [Fulvivirga imtechensis]ELR72836.1 hypothetical protein C900_00797 [Fulvivirga imtechensis AK7]